MINTFVKYRNPIAIVLALVILAGVFSYMEIKTSLFPEITFPKIKVIADNGQQPVNKMMINVTKPLENAIKKVPGLITLRSLTSRGSCEISAFMNWNVDIDLAKQQLESRLAEINNDLPANTQITVEKMNPSILQIMGYSLESSAMSQIELKLLAEYTVKPYLSRVEGIASVEVIGGKTKEYWIIPDLQKMMSLAMTTDKIREGVAKSNFIQSNGYLVDYHRMYLSITDAAPANMKDIEEIVIARNGGRIIRIKDIAKLEVREKYEYVKINANEKDVPLIAIMKQPDANLIDVSSMVQTRVEELQQMLPKGVSLKPYYIQANFVHDSIRSIIDALWIGLALAIFVAILFLRSAKASAVILITIPITMALTLVIIHLFNYTFNIMTLGAIAASIGLIIDDAIVVVEQIHRTHEEYPEEATLPLVKKAISFLFPAMLSSSLSTIVIFIPFILMSGVAGSYFKILTSTMIIILVSSFFISWIGLPVIYILLSRKNKGPRTLKSHPVKSQRWVPFFIRRPLISICGLILIGLSIIYILPKLQTGFLPEMDEGSIVLDYVSPPGTSLEETDRILKEVDKIIYTTPEVQSYSRRTGTQMGFFITEPNTGDYLIQLKKSRVKTTEEISDDVRKKIESTQPALRVDFGQVVGDMLGDLMTSVQPVEIKIFGNDQTRIHEIAKNVAGLIDSVKGTADVFNGITIAGPTIRIIPDQEKLAFYGMTPDNLQQQMQINLDGLEAGSVMEKEQMTPIRIIHQGGSKNSLEKYKNDPVFLPGGLLRKAENFAQIILEPGAAEIERENLQTMVPVTARLNGRDLGGVMKDVQSTIHKNIVLPAGYQIEYGGAFAQQVKSFRELSLILIASALLVLVIIVFVFRDIFISFIILVIAIAGMGGSIIALYITGTPLNVGSYTGIIMIIGIIGENAIFTYQQFRTSWSVSSIDDAITYAISTRLRPKLMTAFGAIIALLPLSMGIGTGAQMHQPLAIAVTGGFLMALPLLLIVFPSFIRLFGRYLRQPEIE
jgi:CzcA family heavy metal efflux pump